MASKILPIIMSGALALAVSGMAVAQNAPKANPSNTDESANSANRDQQPTGARSAPSGQMAPSTTTGSGAKSDLGKNPKGSGGAERPIPPMTDEEKTSAEPKR
jgi:hypothetical protein